MLKEKLKYWVFVYVKGKTKILGLQCPYIIVITPKQQRVYDGLLNTT